MIKSALDPKYKKTVVEHNTCDFHKKNPGKKYAGCTCSSSYTLKGE